MATDRIVDLYQGLGFVSIPKRVSEVLWPKNEVSRYQNRCVSIPKRVSEVLWQAL